MATITYTVTVAYDGTANIYYLDGSAKPALTFTRGNTYEFDLSNSSNSGHPLAFKDSLGSSYTTGVTTTGTAGSAGAKVSIVVNALTPSQLRYYCTVHGNYMGNTISVPAVSTYNAIYGTGQYGKAAYGVATADVALTGVAATGSIQPVAVNGFEVDISEPLESVSASGSIGTLIVDVLQPIAGVSANGIAGQIGVGAGGNILSAAATGLVNGVTVNVAERLAGVAASFTLNAAGLDIRSINKVPVTSSAMTGSIGSVSPNILHPISGVFATGFVNTLRENPSESLASVSATGSIGTLTLVATSNFTLTGVSATGLVNTVRENPDEVLGSVSATGAVGSVRVLVVEKISSVLGTGAIGTPTTTGASTVFDPDNFSRTRTIRLVEIQSSRRAA